MERDLETPADRIRWAIDHSKRSLTSIAEEVGCTHATLSLWQTGGTTVDNAKAGLLVRFAAATGTSLDWLLTGNGPRLNPTVREAEPPLVTLARRIVEQGEDTAALAARVLQAINGDDKAPKA